MATTATAQLPQGSPATFESALQTKRLPFRLHDFTSIDEDYSDTYMDHTDDVYEHLDAYQAHSDFHFDWNGNQHTDWGGPYVDHWDHA